MHNDHQVNAPSLFVSWGAFALSLAANALPYVQLLALLLSCVASYYVIKKNRK